MLVYLAYLLSLLFAVSGGSMPESHTPLTKKRSMPGATVEHMIKKYRTSTSQPGSRASSPTHLDKRKKPNQFDIHNIEVRFSILWHAILNDLLREFVTSLE